MAAQTSSAVPSTVKTLLDARKFDEASIHLYEMIKAAQGDDHWPLITLVSTIDPNPIRLDAALAHWLQEEKIPDHQQWLAKNLGELRLLKRDFQGAVIAFDAGGANPDLQLRSGSIYLLLGDLDAAQTRLAAVLSSNDDALVEPATCALAWKNWADGNTKAAWELVRTRAGPSALGLQCLLARSMGMKKEELAAREKLRSTFPRSVYFNLIDSDSDPSTQMDTALMVLLGIGPAAGGDDPQLAIDDNQTIKGIQVGYFSSGINARKLADNLKKKGFQTQIEEEKNSQGRWKVMVLVPSGKDPQSVIISLKDLGIEGFLSF